MRIERSVTEVQRSWDKKLTGRNKSQVQDFDYYMHVKNIIAGRQEAVGYMI